MMKYMNYSKKEKIDISLERMLIKGKLDNYVGATLMGLITPYIVKDIGKAINFKLTDYNISVVIFVFCIILIGLELFKNRKK